MNKRPDISIIGPGKVGTAIGILAGRAGWNVVAVAGRDRQHAEATAKRIGPSVRVTTPAQAASVGGLILLTVNDQAIEPLCEELASAGVLRHGTIVAHCCGAMSSEILASARALAGCEIASIHPLQTFPSVERAIESLAAQESFCFCEGDEPALDVMEELARAIGTHPIRMDSSLKVLYHTAAVMACNYSVALMDAAIALCRQAGIDPDQARKAFGPLVSETVRNVTTLGPAQALTGPIARGDVQTVRQHLDAMQSVHVPIPKDLVELYRSAGRWTIDLAMRKGSIDEQTAKKLYETLESQ